MRVGQALAMPFCPSRGDLVIRSSRLASGSGVGFHELVDRAPQPRSLGWPHLHAPTGDRHRSPRPGHRS